MVPQPGSSRLRLASVRLRNPMPRVQVKPITTVGNCVATIELIDNRDAKRIESLTVDVNLARILAGLACAREHEQRGGGNDLTGSPPPMSALAAPKPLLLLAYVERHIDAGAKRAQRCARSGISVVVKCGTSLAAVHLQSGGFRTRERGVAEGTGRGAQYLTHAENHA